MDIRTTAPTNALVLLVVASLLAAPAAAQDCDTPLFVQQGTVDANVMILFDNSGSMNTAMYHPEYNPDVDWSGPFYDRTYYVGWDDDYAPRDVNGRPSGAWHSSPKVDLVHAPGQWARYPGNYLNWLFYNATDQQRDSVPVQTRMHVAHDVITEIIDRASRVNIGLTVFNTSDYGRVVAECGASTNYLKSTVNNIQGTTWTPLGETMETILNYFKGSNSPIMAECQQNFCVVVTDGFPTKDRSVSGYLWDHDNDGHDPGNCESIGSPDPNSNDCSDHLDDVAHYMFTEDMSGDFDGDQNVITYTIGFGVDAPILQDTADNGDGTYFLAEDAVDLWESLEAVMLDIISRISSGAAVAVVSTERGDDERLYRGKFMPGTWHGYLEAFELPYEPNEPPIWEAGVQLAHRSPDSRVIHVGLGTNMFYFDPSAANDLMGPMGLSDVGETRDVIAWTRGEDLAGMRDRDHWPLGDIIHSTPVVVGSPSTFTVDQEYQEFMERHEGRTKMVYVGSNDGMLHAFDAEYGREIWAFVPEFVLDKMPDMADSNYCHKYAVDLTPTVRDCKVNGDWRTVLVCGGREGGAGYFALDVTYPDVPGLLWQVELNSGKAFSSEVEFATIDGEDIVLMGSGLDEATGVATLEAYTVSDGAYLGSQPLSNDSSDRNRATAPTAIDVDLDGSHDYCYIADLQGHLWRVDFNGTTSAWSWSKDCLWSTDAEITARPIAAYGEGNDVHVYLGTGAYLDTDDLTAYQDNVFACVVDRQDGSEYANLVDQTNSIHDIDGQDGWYIRLEESGLERVTEPAVAVAGVVFFTSFAPSSELCAAGGYSWLYRMDFQDGSVPDDGEDDEWDGNRNIELGEGVASRPVVDIVNETVIVQGSDATITVEEIGQAYFHLTVRAWQENFDYVSVPSQSIE